MGVLDRFLDIMKLSDDDDYEDDDFYDDDDDYDDYEDEEEEEEKPKRSFFNRSKKKSDDEEEDEEEETTTVSTGRASNKVTPMRQPSNRKAAVQMEVCVIKPNTVEDAREITETLLSGRTVILNLEGLDLEIAQRIIDFTSGAAYAIAGNLQKISNYIFLVTPTNVDISGDLQDLLNTSFDESSMSRY